jgi:hypothetical protein
MAEKKEKVAKHFQEHIPEDVREHIKAAHAERRASIKTLFPPEFIAHRKAARKEMLLALQAIVSHAIERLEDNKRA